MKSLTKKLENRIVVRLFAFMGIGAGLSAAVACLLTRVAEYRDFLAVPDAENNLMLSVSGWILLLLPLVMFLAVPAERKNLSFAAVLLIPIAPGSTSWLCAARWRCTLISSVWR